MTYLEAAKAQADALAERYRNLEKKSDLAMLFPALIEAQGLYEAAARVERAGVTDEEIRALVDLIPQEKPEASKPSKAPTKK